MGSHIVEEAIPSLFTWWQKGSEPQERTYCSNMQGLFQPLLVSYFLMSHWPQQAMSPRQNHWQGPSAGVDTGKHGGCRLLLQQFASRCLAGVSPEMKAAVLLSALFASAVLLSALFAFLLRMVSWDGCSQWIRCSAPWSTWALLAPFSLCPATLQRLEPSGSQIDGYSQSQRAHQESVAGSARI